eukprot:g23786.t1
MDERLFDAARRNQAEEVEEVIKANPELLSLQDRWGLTALHSSAVAGGAEVIAVLLEARAELEAPSRSGQTALHFAAREGRDAAVAELIRRHADVSRRSAHGILPLELAAGHPNTQQLIREEANRRIKVAEQDIEMLQERLQRAVEAKELLEAQLTEPPASHHSTMLSDAEILAPITALQQATRDLARSAALADDASQDYWRRAAAWLGVQRHRGWAALYGSYMRDPVNGAGAAGACMEPANAPPLPVFDPERDDATVGPSESKEVPEGEAPPAPPPLVFEAGDLVGPIGGLLRRKKAYMAEHYGSSVWFFHDPNAHELPLRIQSTELRTEPLVVDLSLGSSNRLRFLRDPRTAQLLPPPSDASLAEQSLISEPLWPARSAMARINSRSLPPSLAPPMSAPMSRGPDSPIAASLAASSICASSYEQMVLAPAEANVQIVDVHVHGWPYSFVVATNPIYAEEELVLDRGEEFWARQRKVLERLQLVGPTMEEILTGVTLPEPAPPDLKSGRAKLMGGLQQDCGRSDHLVAEGRGETSELSQRLSFPTLQLQAGTLVICYCAQLTDDACTGTWFYLGLLQVSGPQPGHRWVLPTRQKVGLQDLQGWGFRVDDRLRLLDKGSSCSSAPSSSAYKVGCSSNSSCRVALEDETIEVRVANNLLSGAELLEVHVESDSSSILTFSAPIGHLLQDGDAIYLEPESILIDGRGLISMSEDEQFDAMLLAGLLPAGPSVGATQGACGALFTELWSDAASGFPVPVRPCSTSQTPRQRTAGTALNRAELKLGGWLRGKWRYGFQLLITNPTGEVGDEKPFSTFGLVDTLKISDLRLPGSGTLRPAAVLRLLAPPQVRFRAEATEARGGRKHSDDGSGGGGLAGAKRFAAPILRSLVGASMRCNSQHVGAFTELRFHIPLGAPLPKESMLLLQADVSTPGLTLHCPMQAEEAPGWVPDSVACAIVSVSASFAWQLTSSVGWAAGSYVLRGQASHVAGISWTISSYSPEGRRASDAGAKLCSSTQVPVSTGHLGSVDFCRRIAQTFFGHYMLLSSMLLI